MTTVKVKLRPSSVVDRPGRIIYLVTKNKITRQIATTHKLFLHEWENKSSITLFSGDNRLRMIFKCIENDIERLKRIIHEFDSKRCEYSVLDVIAKYQYISEENFLFSFMEGVILRLRQLNRISTANNYHAALESIKRFRKDKDILFDEINHILMEDYEVYLQNKSLVPNTTSFYMRILRAVYNRAVEQELTQDKKPFRTVFTGMEKTRKRAISLNEIKYIRNLEFSKQPDLKFACDIFLFLFLCRGMSFIDAAFLKKSDIKNGVLSYRRHKTNQTLHIKVEREMVEIINRYALSDSPYLLPIINHPIDDGRRQYNAAIHKINKSLKKIGEIVNLHIPLTTYVSRHAWATIARHKNIPLAVISEALGHDSETTTQIYLASIESSAIDKANRSIIKDL